ncbi:TRAF3-interacting protein 1 [Drosophila guanche]|uniref:TRAF3-interacting protein 1 n=1 Tax=Drosophila guanche TaxID=7266 RepID=A0A3B0KBL8_DROGU|nr:TRAF3-interacting protein 1 [Drosophila guanche]SPP83066.1 blast:Protein suppressor of hairy wing [Drosophila guanche]
MSSDQELDAIIKATQQALGKYIKKPPLTEKLLKKPPFRFLMDVFNSFIKQTATFEGLYTFEEQQFENIGDREAKIRFLQKMIDAIKLTTKRDLKVRTSKIVAGQEPELTNELLQAMASVAEQSLDWQTAVDQVAVAATALIKPAKEKPKKENKPPSKQTSPSGKEEEAKRAKEKRVSPQEQKLRKATALASRGTPTEKEKLTQKKVKATAGEAKLSRQASKQKSPSPVKQKAKTKGQASTESDTVAMSMSPVPAAVAKQPSPEAVPKKASAEAVPKNASPEAATKSSSPEAAPKKASPEAVTKKPSPSSSPKVSKEAAAELAQESTAPPTESESRKSSSKSRRSSGSQRQLAAAQAEPEQPASSSKIQQQQPEPSAQADSNNNNQEEARQVAAPLTRENSKETNQRPRTSLRPPSARPASARPGAPRRRNVEIVLQPNDQIKMSGINVKLETFGDLDDDGENLVIIEDANSHDIEKGAEEPLLEGQVDAQGRLVQQILETQKELVHQSAETEQPATQPNQTARQSSARQVNDLRDLIQSLTKAVNPLGKLMDFIPEDIDAMQLELTMWRDTYTQAATELKRERSLTASATEPMKHQLQQIDASIAEYEELIDESRHKILQNNARILKMLMEQ